MKKLLILALLLYFSPAEAAITLVGHKAAQSDGTAAVGRTVTTQPMNTTGATLLVAAISVVGANTRSITDNFANTWVQVVQKIQGNSNVTLYYVQNPLVGVGHTFTGGTFATSVVVHAFAGTDTTAAVDEFASSSAATGFQITTGSITPTTNGEVIVTAAACGPAKLGDNDALTDGFFVTDSTEYISGAAGDLSTGYLIQTTAAAINPTWTVSGAANPCVPAAVIASFKAAASPPAPPTPGPNVFFISGFEMGYPPINNTLGDTTFVWGGANFSGVGTGTAKHGGAYYMDEANVGAGTETSMYSTGTYASQTVSCRLYVQIMQQTTTVQAVSNMFQYFGSGGVKHVELGLGTDRKCSLANIGGFPFVAGTNALTPFGTWNRIDVIYSAAVGGVLKVYINNVLDIDTTHTGTNTDVVTMRVHGIQGGTPVGNLRYDDFLCQDGTARPPDGRVIARQGVASTPIDNAWTQVSCTGTVASCSSNTPMTTASHIHSTATTASLAQTMKVWPFNTVQTGHGPETLTGADTINAVQIAMVAKTSSATVNDGERISIRRYTSGIFIQDYPVFLTTADAFIKSPIWQDTIANLDLYEIGVVKPVTGTAIDQTVEDMWVLVDCSGPGCIPPTSRPKVRVTQ